MGFTQVGDALNKKVNAHKTLKGQIEAADAVEVAASVFVEEFGTDEGIHVKPLFLKNRTLTVTCSSGAVAQEIRLNQAKIVGKINEKIGKNDVDRIRYLS